MRTFCLAASVLLGLGLTSCNREPGEPRDRAAARQAGREAYRASQQLKRGAKEAAHDLHDASKEFREGWTEAEHENRAHPKK